MFKSTYLLKDHRIIPTTGDFFKFVKKLKEYFKNDFEKINV